MGGNKGSREDNDEGRPSHYSVTAGGTSVPPATPEVKRVNITPGGGGGGGGRGPASKRRASVRDIFSPTRESHSPAAPTPPPASYVVPEGDDEDEDEDEDEGEDEDEDEDDVGEMKHLSQHQKIDAIRMSFALGMDRTAFLELKEEKTSGEDAEHHELFSYQELLRRAFTKDYGTCEPHKLEQHLPTKEFELKFEMTRENFYQLPVWRQRNLKKMLLLF